MMSTTTASKAHIGKRATFTRAVAYNWFAWRAFLEAIMTCDLQVVINCSIMFYLLLYLQFVVMINASEISKGWKPLCIDNHLELSAPPPNSASQLVLVQLRGERVLSIPCPHSEASVYTDHTDPFWCREELASQLKGQDIIIIIILIRYYNIFHYNLVLLILSMRTFKTMDQSSSGHLAW